MNAPFELITRKEFMKALNYKSISAFRIYVSTHPDCPRPVRRSNLSNSRVFFLKSEVDAYLQSLYDLANGAMPGDDFVRI